MARVSDRSELADAASAQVLDRLAQASALTTGLPPRAAHTGLLALVADLCTASRVFLARVDPSGLTPLLAYPEEGGLPTRRELERVSLAVREALDGVASAPPEAATGGRAPQGAVAVKAEAGNPPVHAFPLLFPPERDDEPISMRWAGVLGIVPSPTAPAEPDPAVDVGLSVLRNLIDLPSLRQDTSLEGSPEGGRSFKYHYDEIVTQSPKLHSIFRKLDRITGARVPVLICGETGTGKELIARAVHRNDPHRRHKRFYTQNCGAIPGSLLESELFGYEKGAFTGADARKKGLFEIASGSTLFLDEIGETSLDMQTRLLRVLQEREVVPLGSNEPVKVDVRIVAATLRDLEGDIRAGRFREDLYYRLKVVRLDLPPLRERPEDVPQLVEHFLRKAAREVNAPAKVLDRRDPRVLEVLTRYAWPGNIRELENVIRRLAYLTPGEVVTHEALAEADPGLLAPSEAEPEARPVRLLEEVVEEVERHEIENALRVTEGNRTQAAKLLGINRRSLLRRLQKYSGLAE